jgi:hypothetical protein
MLPIGRMNRYNNLNLDNALCHRYAISFSRPSIMP